MKLPCIPFYQNKHDSGNYNLSKEEGWVSSDTCACVQEKNVENFPLNQCLQA